MNESTYAVRAGSANRRSPPGRGLLVALALAGCGGSDPTLGDLPAGVASARPSITAEEAKFVLAAQKLGAAVTGATVNDDIETGTTTCWALKNGGVELAQIAVDDDNKPLAQHRRGAAHEAAHGRGRPDVLPRLRRPGVPAQAAVSRPHTDDRWSTAPPLTGVSCGVSGPAVEQRSSVGSRAGAEYLDPRGPLALS